MGKDLLGLVQARGVFFINFPYSYIQVPGNQREKTRFAEYRLTKILLAKNLNTRKDGERKASHYSIDIFYLVLTMQQTLWAENHMPASLLHPYHLHSS